MSDSITAFQADLGKFAEKLHLKVGTVMKKVSADLWTKISERTPVDTGRARANWFLTVGAPSQQVEMHEGAKTGQIPAPPPPDVSGIDGTQPVYIVNNLKYIEPLENGHSQQAPSGMVKLAMQEVATNIERAIKE